MMDEYINRTKLIEDIKSRFCEGCDPSSGNMRCRNCKVSYAIGEIKGAPKIEVEEVEHGYWIEYSLPPILTCSECDWGEPLANKHYKRCPMCGAKMDGGAE